MLHNISITYPLYPRLNVGFGLQSRRGDELTFYMLKLVCQSAPNIELNIKRALDRLCTRSLCQG